MEGWVALLISIGGTISGTVAGAVVGLTGARKLSRDERMAQERTETLRSFRNYVGEVVQSVAELRQLPAVPETNRVADLATGLVDRVRGEAAVHMATRMRIHQRYGDRYFELAGKLAAAAIDLRLRNLPETARAAVDRANDYVERLGENRSSELIAEWKGVHADLMAAGEELQRALPS